MDFVFYRKKLNILRQLQCNDCLRIKGDVMISTIKEMQ